MADPLSIAASFAGLIALAELVVCRIHKYGRAAVGANELSLQLTTLFGVLQSPKLLTSQMEGERFESTKRLYHIYTFQRTFGEYEKDLGQA